VTWYPYLKCENIPPDMTWLQWLQRVFANDTPGLSNCFFTALDENTRAYVGVVWTAVSEATPELAHLGWFLVEDQYQGQGIGRQILQNYITDVEARGVQMIMLPTQVSNRRAVGMYERRGWEITMAQPDEGTRCWMVREPEFGYQREYFRRQPGPLEVGPVQVFDYIALDYLLCRPTSESRLLPGYAGQTRFCAFIVDWREAQYLVARQGTRPVGVATLYERKSYFDAFALDETVLRELLVQVTQQYPEAQTLVAESDEVKYKALRDLGFRMGSGYTLELSGEEVRLRRMSR
jgi:GNAT superfamily N-acetyltransferase